MIASVVVLALVGCSGIPGDSGGPSVSIEGPQQVSISPQSSPGIKDFYGASVDVELVDGTELYSYAVTVALADGETVYSRDYSVSDLETLSANPETPPVPQRVEWLGRDSADQPVPEGRYMLSIEIVDSFERRAESPAVEIEVDNTPPSALVALSGEVFSPDGDGTRDTILIEQNSSGGDTWMGYVNRLSSQQRIRSFSWNDGLPADLRWDGENNRGNTAAPGRYSYTLVARDNAGNRAIAETEAFRLDTEVAELDLMIAPRPFTPDGDGTNDRVRIEATASDPASISSWRVSIYDPTDTLFREFSGEGAPTTAIVWDGRGSDGERVQAATDYQAEFQVRDSAGNSAAVDASIPVGILVDRQDDGSLRIRISSIHFVPFEADYQNLENPERVEQNMEVLDELARMLGNYPDHSVRLEGHAVHLRTGEAARQTEQEEVLVPLSRKRAEAIRDALVKRGLDGGRFSIAGVGGAEPVVPHTNEEERWKNRRVEFILVRE